MKDFHKQSGFILLVSVLLISAIGVTIVTTVLILSVDSAKTFLAKMESSTAEELALTCANEALEQIRKDHSSSGTVNLSFSRGDCAYTIIDQGGENRNIEASGMTEENVTRKIEIDIDQINPRINITSYRQVADFS